jgi:hypothetical protein
LRKSRVGGGCAELLAFEVFWQGDAAALAGHDRKGRAVVDHEHRLDGGTGILVAKLDERIDVCKAHLVRAGGNARNRIERARTTNGADGPSNLKSRLNLIGVWAVASSTVAAAMPATTQVICNAQTGWPRSPKEPITRLLAWKARVADP